MKTPPIRHNARTSRECLVHYYRRKTKVTAEQWRVRNERALVSAARLIRIGFHRFAESHQITTY